jgi:hypothetical protein
MQENKMLELGDSLRTLPFLHKQERFQQCNPNSLYLNCILYNVIKEICL